MSKLDGEQRQHKAYNERKHCEESQRRRNEKLKRQKDIAHRHQMAIRLFENQPDVEGEENERYRRAVDELAVQWQQRQNTRRQHLDQMRTERIANQMREAQESEALKRSESVRQCVDVKNRLQNEEINLIHECQRRAAKTRQVKELQELIRSQIVARQKSQTEQFDKERADTNRVIHDTAVDEDRTFMSYANQLMTAAENAGRPTFPLIKVINEYRKQHRLLRPKSNLPHLKSNIKMDF